MRYSQLGNTGLYVSNICLGTMTFGGQGFWKMVGNLEQPTATKLIGRALEAGVNFLDTADVYSEGRSEQMVGQAFKDLGLRRSEIVLATKCCGRVGRGVNDIGASRGHILDAVERSLERLQTNYIDLYQIHANDPITPVEETMGALDDLVRRGLVRYAAVSNWQAWKIVKANEFARHRGLARFETLQAYYSIAGRDLERDWHLERSGVAVGGVSGKARVGELNRWTHHVSTRILHQLWSLVCRLYHCLAAPIGVVFVRQSAVR